MRRSSAILLLAGAAAAGLSGCRAELPQSRSVEAAPPPHATQSALPSRSAAETVNFNTDPYLQDACQGSAELRFQSFESDDFVYDSPLPVRVSGAYYEVRAGEAAGAATVYEEVKATIFRRVEMVVGADQTAPHFSFERWSVLFAVSGHPFSASRQLKHQRAMGATFPFLDLANIEQPDPDNANFSGNFISTLNFLATRGESLWGRASSREERERAHALRRATTGTNYERPQRIAENVLAALRSVPPGETLSLHQRGNYILISLGQPLRFVAAIDTTKDATGLHACAGEL